jgi:hypothetical protein
MVLRFSFRATLIYQGANYKNGVNEFRNEVTCLSQFYKDLSEQKSISDPTLLSERNMLILKNAETSSLQP